MASMLSPILSVWISTERRRLVQVVPDQVLEVWDIWDLRILVLISFLCHFLLLTMAKSRKNSIRLEKPVWALYSISDWVSNASLGIISSKVGDQVGYFGEHEANRVLIAFWSTLLLVHMGGSHTITAEALEDNALWPRTFLVWILQTIRVLYIVLSAWRSENWLSYFSIGMLLVGFIKCGERTWAQYYASTSNENYKIKEGPNKSNLKRNNELENDPEESHGFVEDFKSCFAGIYDSAKMSLGILLERFNLKNRVNRNIESDNQRETETDIPRDPCDLFENFRLFFVSLFKDFVLSSDNLLREQDYFRRLGYEKAFQYVDGQLGSAYDVLYTKAYVMFSPIGMILRACTLFIVLVTTEVYCMRVASKTEMHGISKSDRVITLFLVGGIFSQEILTAKMNSLFWNNRLRRSEDPRSGGGDNITDESWLARLRKCNFLTFYLKNTDSWMTYKHCQLFLKRKSEVCKVDEKLKKNIFKYFSTEGENGMNTTIEGSGLKSIEWTKGKNGMNTTIEGSGLKSIEWTKLLEFHQGILTWHIATGLCYHGSDDVQGLNDTVKSKVDISKNLSEYMLYLLATQRHMLPIGRGVITFPATCNEAVLRCFGKSKVPSDNYLREACDKLLQFNFESNTGRRPEYNINYSNSALFDACRLARSLINEMETVKRWEFLANVWMEILGYAATHCRAEQHAQQLKRGGEFLSHVWLLMAHLGLMEQFQVINTGTPTDSEGKSIDQTNEQVDGNTVERVQKQEDRIDGGEIKEAP